MMCSETVWTTMDNNDDDDVTDFYYVQKLQTVWTSMYIRASISSIP